MLLGLASACSSDPPAPHLPAVQWQSAHFRYAAWPDDTEACAGVTDVLEEHWAFWHDQLGLPELGRAEILYSKARDDGELLDQKWCPGTSGGCTTGTDVRSYLLFDKHELIHAYLAETMPPPVPLFAEGAAVAFSCDAGGLTGPDPPPAWRNVLDPPSGDPGWYSLYPTGGRLVSLLFTRFGAHAFIRFYAAIGMLTDPDAIAEKFQSTFGTTLDDVWADAAASPICLALWECTRPIIPLDATPQTGPLVCGKNLVPRTLQIDVETNVVASIRNAPSNLGLGPTCGDSTAPGGLSLWPGGSFTLLADLVPGTYVVNLGGGEMTATPIATPSVGGNCADLVPYPVVADGLPLFVAAARRTAYARVGFAEPRNGVLSGEISPGAPTALWSCPACTTDWNSCPMAGDLDVRAVFQGDYAWNMQTYGPSWAMAYFKDPP